MRPARPWSSHRMNSSTSGCKKPNDNKRIVTDGGQAVEEKDIVDHLSEATGYFHDDDAERLRDIADHGGQKPVGVVKAAVEKEIERREWRCVYFDREEDREYIASNAHEYYRIHRKLQREHEAALESLPKETNQHLRESHQYEAAASTLQEKAREHQAKAEQAESYLKENEFDIPEVEIDA